MQTAAIYLPGFHECPLNSAWWGEGATEWDSIRSAKPQFLNHQQPKTPLWGHYDLSDTQIIAKQAALAAEFGIDGFCIYHYWSEGRRPLKKPLELILENPNLNVKFTLCWANHTWFTTWKGFKSRPKILMPQTYENDKARRQLHVDFLLRALSDARAMRVNSRPIISVLDPRPATGMADFIDQLRSTALERFGLEILCSAWVHDESISHSSIKDLLKVFDDIIVGKGALRKQRKPKLLNGLLVNPLWLSRRVPTAFKTDLLRYFHWRLAGKVNTEATSLDYDLYWQDYLRSLKALSSLHPRRVNGMLLVDWDNTPRMGSRGSYFENFDLDKLAHFSRELRSVLGESNPTGVLYINAWNEWGEGSYLEPDTQSGTARLQAVS